MQCCAHRSGNSCFMDALPRARVASRRVVSRQQNSLAQGVYLLCTLARPFPRRFISWPRKPRRCAAGFIIRFNSVLEGYWSVQTWSVMRAVEKSPPPLSLSFFPYRPFHFTFRDRSKNLICREREQRPSPPSPLSLALSLFLLSIATADFSLPTVI